ncbi:phosphopantetheine-binding protein [Mammaliicoccus sciuri]|uniref:phosphopantetheine-binding protein n=1 Tax=Mammaliicoccus sciuri TaxID=1296 RepID=UPI0028985B03|nr:phosphopantetheine-binding protein [Mammaliicoccus sciuri]
MDYKNEIVIDKGKKIEYQNIEFELKCLHDVEDAQVFRIGQNLTERLVALLVPENEGISISNIRRNLREKSPHIVIPEEINIVYHIDKNRTDGELLEIYNKLFKHQSNYTRPQNPVEDYLVKLWGELIPATRISRDDDFYTLGGHSLLVAKMHFSIERDMGVGIDFEVMLKTSKLSELANSILTIKREEIL